VKNGCNSGWKSQETKLLMMRPHPTERAMAFAMQTCDRSEDATPEKHRESTDGVLNTATKLRRRTLSRSQSIHHETPQHKTPTNLPEPKFVLFEDETSQREAKIRGERT